MARSFHQSLLAAVVALVVGGSAVAQSDLQEAVIKLRVGEKEEAATMLREILQSDPSNEQAHDLYQSISQDEWFLLMSTQGEIQKIAQSILERAKVGRAERSRDEDTIAGLVATATDDSNDYGTRQAAINSLVADHGEFAVPALVQILGDPDNPNGQIHAINVLAQLHAVAVLPLIETLKSDNELLVQNAAATLLMINDSRATPMMAHLANDDRENVRTIASKFVKKAGVDKDALSLMVDQAVRYLNGIVPAGGFSDVVWQLEGDQLVAKDVPALLYPSELAKSVAGDAVRIAPSSKQARTWLAAANLAQAELIDNSIAAGDESTAEMGPIAEELRIAALATGTDALRGALDAGVDRDMSPVAIGAIHALADAENMDAIGDSSLLAALNSSNKQIKYAAAEAIVTASRGSNVPASSAVVSVLAQAVTEQRVHTIQVIAPDNAAKSAVEIAGTVRGQAPVWSDSAISGMNTLLNNPTFDVVVVNEILPDGMPEDVIGNIRKDPRMANTKIVVVTKDTDAAAERFGDEVGFIQAPLSAENLQEAVATALEGIDSPGGERAESYASKASAALLDLASRKADISPALENLALQLNRGDAVAVPAAKAIGLSGGSAQLPALVGALQSDSEELKKASARAIGNILTGMDNCPEDVSTALMAAMEGADVELRRAIATALGKANMDAGKKLELFKKLSRVASAEG